MGATKLGSKIENSLSTLMWFDKSGHLTSFFFFL